MKKMATVVLGFIVICFIGWFFAFVLMSLEDNRAWGAEGDANISTGDYHWVAPTGIPYGNQNAPVVIVEFSDFICPYCKISSSNLLEAVRESNGKAMVVMRQFPLPFHGDMAKQAARAVIAAGRQGKFWAMVEKLFAEKDLLEKDIHYFATELDLDLKKFNDDLNATTTVAEVDRDFKEAISIGVNAAPTFFFNGRAYVGAATKEKFLSLIAQAEEELKKVSSCGVGGICADGDTDVDSEEVANESADGDLTPDGDTTPVTEKTETVDGDVVETTEEVVDGDSGETEVEEISATDVANFLFPGLSGVINVANKIAAVDGDIDFDSEEAVSESADGDLTPDGDTTPVTEKTETVDGDVVETTEEVVDGDSGETEAEMEIEAPDHRKVIKEAIVLLEKSEKSEAEKATDENTDSPELKEFMKDTLIVAHFSFTGFKLGKEDFERNENAEKILQEIKNACAPECYIELTGQADRNEIRSAGKILQANAQTVLGLRRADTVRRFLWLSEVPALTFSTHGEWGSARDVRVIVRKSKAVEVFNLGNGNATGVSGQGGFAPPAKATDTSMESMTKIINSPRKPIFGVGVMAFGRCGFSGCNAGGGVQMDFLLTERLTLRLEGSLSASFADRPKGGFHPNSPRNQLGFSVGSELTYQPRKWLEVGGGFAFTEGYAFPGAKFAKWSATWREWELTLPVYFQVWEKDGQALSLFVRPALGVSVWGPDSHLFLATPSGTIGLVWRFGKW